MKKYFLLLFLLHVLTSNGQVTFQRVYGVGEGVFIQQTYDNGYIIAIKNPSSGLGKYIKLNEFGDPLWSKTVYSTTIACIRQTIDGGYIFTGRGMDFSGNYDATLTKTNSTGDSIWMSSFYTSNFNRFGLSCLESFSGGYVMSNLDAQGAGNYIYYLTSTDTAGNFIWDTGGGSGSPTVRGGPSLQSTLDSNYISVLNSWTLAPEGGFTLEKTNPNGSYEWSKSYYDQSFVYGYSAASISENSDSTFVVAGSFRNSGQDFMYLLKADKNGDSLWSKTILPGYLNDAVGDCGGGFMAVGSGLLINTDQNGDTTWTRELSGLGIANGMVIQRTNDSGFVIVGSTTDTILNETYVYVVKTDCMGNTVPLAISESPESGNEFSITPNPTNSTFTISSTIPIAAGLVEIYNLPGKKLYSGAINKKQEAISVDDFAPGLYFVKIWNGKNSCLKKLVVE